VPSPDVFRNAIVLTGPTGSGKSALALTLAERLGAEIIAMDSMTLYRGMDIGTAKPSPEDRRRVPHHLIDMLDPWESASVAWWLDRAAECVRDIERCGRRALIVGGTPLYLKALLRGLFEGPPADPELRARLETEAERDGDAALHARLAAVDPVAATRLHPNDRRRVVRALEVWELTGRPISTWQQQWKSQAPKPKSQRVPSPGWDLGFGAWDFPRVFCLARPRPELYARIDRRVLDMLAAGWLDEARRLRESTQPPSRETAAAVGYRDLWDYLDGLRSWEETVPRIQQRTRQYAKRQLTWFRHLPECRPVAPELTIGGRESTMNLLDFLAPRR
jgi:tRNA dimethylallyltransferase